MAKANGGARTPREFFEPLFEAVLEEMEQNPDFAARVAEKLGDQIVIKIEGRRRAPVAPPAELDGLDVAAALADEGQIRLRERLGRYKNAELGALVRERKWSDQPVSKLNKTQLLNAIIRAAQ